ncbi:hypothetical protein F0L17_03715 [Streptomyces sp. TRM43335]|uniref:Integral membrane protein n=1 Tax=Streptomyces taklimakanensis TaxID=2569853 RepID=A0A6G2B7K6_9ACTN|nr:hypothetical protein [Streptomyces taklimakanensis]MTE18247.1 hypothetical protein [Streptomyces taklimakanensis]
MADGPARPPSPRTPAPGGGLGRGPGRLLVTLYAVFAVGATSRSAYQLSTRFHEAPLAYSLSAVAAAVYVVITVALIRGGEGARRVGLVCCAAELVGVLTVGTWTVLDPDAFPDATVWSGYGMGYLLLPLVLPVVGLLWLRRPHDGPDPVRSSPA